jgi:hypothetical protein
MYRVISVLVCVIAAAAPALAAPNLLDLKVAYSAETVIGSGDHPRIGHLWRTPTAMRHDMTENGQTETIIVQLDRKAAWMLLPTLKLALGTDLDGLAQLPGAAAVLEAGDKLKPVAAGTDVIDGLRATKYHVQMDDPVAGQFDGYVWSTRQGIILKIDGAGEQNGRRGDIHLQFRNVQVGPQDVALFEPPAAYRHVTVPPAAVGAMIKGIEQMQRLKNGPPPAQEPR